MADEYLGSELDKPIASAEGEDDSPITDVETSSLRGCVHKGLRYPVGARVCLAGRVSVCKETGSWANTGKPC